MGEIIVNLFLSYEQYRAFYEGHVSQVHATAEDGRTVRFPAQLLRQYLTPNGISGRFCLRYDKKGKIRSMERL